MKFTGDLLSGALIKRYKRFFVDVKIKNNILTAHCPNSGSMLGLLSPENKVWISKSNNPKRKLKYTLELIDDGYSKVGVNTHMTNKIVFEAIKNKKISFLNNYTKIEPEKSFNKNTRFDFFLTSSTKKCFVEVKNVTLKRQSKLAEFPDAVTSRGLKHLHELIRARKEGFECYMIYLIQREDCDKFKIAKDIDKNYYQSFNKAINSGVKIASYDCKISTTEILLNNLINYTN